MIALCVFVIVTHGEWPERDVPRACGGIIPKISRKSGNGRYNNNNPELSLFLRGLDYGIDNGFTNRVLYRRLVFPRRRDWKHFL